ncbi:MAG: hypothetical protein ACUVSI_10425 [Actinomycetota bacterium]
MTTSLQCGIFFQDTGHYGHQGELILFDHRDQRHKSGVAEYAMEAAETMRDRNFGVGLGAFMLEASERDRIFGPNTWDYPSWQRRIKEMLDPDGVADGTFYCADRGMRAPAVVKAADSWCGISRPRREVGGGPVVPAPGGAWLVTRSP